MILTYFENTIQGLVFSNKLRNIVGIGLESYAWDISQFVQEYEPLGFNGLFVLIRQAVINIKVGGS